MKTYLRGFSLRGELIIFSTSEVCITRSGIFETELVCIVYYNSHRHVFDRRAVEEVNFQRSKVGVIV